MKDKKDIFLLAKQRIQEIEELTKGKNFKECCEILNPHNIEDSLADFNYKEFCFTLLDKKGIVVLSDNVDYYEENDISYSPLTLIDV